MNSGEKGMQEDKDCPPFSREGAVHRVAESDMTEQLNKNNN